VENPNIYEPKRNKEEGIIYSPFIPITLECKEYQKLVQSVNKEFNELLEKYTQNMIKDEEVNESKRTCRCM